MYLVIERSEEQLHSFFFFSLLFSFSPFFFLYFRYLLPSPLPAVRMNLAVWVLSKYVYLSWDDLVLLLLFVKH